MDFLIDSQMPTLIFGIVTYKERYWECSSFCTLLESFKQSGLDEMLNVFIVDNTDTEGWKLDEKYFGKNISIEYMNLKNLGIAVAYNVINEHACLNSYKWIVFLDQDTILPASTFSVYNKKAKENNDLLPLKAPIIYSNNIILSPCIYKNYRSYPVSKFSKTVFDCEDYSCINSGLMIQSLFFKKVGGYNTGLFVDFCDHDFIERAKKYLDNIELLDLELEQNFSSDTHNKQQSIKRYQIFCQDIKQFYKNRSKFKIFVFVDLSHLLKLTYVFKSTKFFKIRFLE